MSTTKIVKTIKRTETIDPETAKTIDLLDRINIELTGINEELCNSHIDLIECIDIKQRLESLKETIQNASDRTYDLRCRCYNHSVKINEEVLTEQKE